MLGQLDSAFRTGNSLDLPKAACMDAVIQDRTTPEQAEFLAKALTNEIFPDGLTVLQREGSLGTLTSIFPAEVEKWTESAGVNL
jgi:hypothetical protein